jgi:hypothetical protein
MSCRRAAVGLPLLAAILLAACGSSADTSAGVATPATAATADQAATGATQTDSCTDSSGSRATPSVVGDAATTATTTAGPASSDALDQPALKRPFAASSPWNTPVDTSALDARSDAWITGASRRVAVVSAADQEGVSTAQRQARDLRLYINTCAWTPTIVSAEGGETVHIVCRQRDCGPVARQVKTLRVPSSPAPLPQYDGWYSVIDESAGVGYDMWRARRVGDVISYQFIKRWALDGPGFSPPATKDPVAAVGARGSGLPLFAGVIEPGELQDGRIEHALAISVPGPAQRTFVAPASTTNGVNVGGSLPEGARLRLKPGYTSRVLARGANRRSAEAIVTALRTYGAIVVDRSITPTLYARRSSDYGSLLRGNELQGIRLSDLEVVQAGPLLTFPPLGSAHEAV